MHAKLIDDLLDINNKLCSKLWSIPNVSQAAQVVSPPSLVRPHTRDGYSRISEQEARFLYCELLQAGNFRYFYSVETPTKNLYKFSGEGERSASSDVSLYQYSDQLISKVVNVEFKSGNPSEDKIHKDIEKLIREGIVGVWFHTLKGIDTGTLPSVFRKINAALKFLFPYIQQSTLSLVFSFCVIDQSWACSKYFHYTPLMDYEDYVDSFFELLYYVKARKVMVENSNGWITLSK
jgi:hypothetical protein